MRTILIIIMLSSFAFLLGCFTTSEWTNTGHAWTEAELHAYWDGFNDLWALDQSLKDKGYKYGNEPNDINMWADTPPTSIVTMSRGWANCTGWSAYFTDFIKYKKTKNINIVDEYKTYFIRNDLKWHRFVILTVGGAVQMQSNLEFTTHDTPEAILDYWYNKGYHYQKVEESWKF